MLAATARLREVVCPSMGNETRQSQARLCSSLRPFCSLPHSKIHGAEGAWSENIRLACAEEPINWWPPLRRQTSNSANVVLTTGFQKTAPMLARMAVG